MKEKDYPELVAILIQQRCRLWFCSRYKTHIGLRDRVKRVVSLPAWLFTHLSRVEVSGKRLMANKLANVSACANRFK